MLNVFLLLAISWRFFECLDDERGCRRDYADLSLTILDRQLHGYAKSLPVTGNLGNYEAIVREAISISRHGFGALLSSPTFFGDRPSGPIFGARVEEEPTSPPVARRWLYSKCQHASLKFGQKGDEHDLDFLDSISIERR
jgi:hypothetical protein